MFTVPRRMDEAWEEQKVVLLVGGREQLEDDGWALECVQLLSLTGLSGPPWLESWNTSQTPLASFS